MVPTGWKILNFGLCESQKFEKQSFTDDLENRCYYRFHKFYRKTAVSEFLFNKNAGLSPPTSLKRDSNTAVSCKICKIFYSERVP